LPLLPLAALGALNAVVGTLRLGIGRTAPHSAGTNRSPAGRCSHAANSVPMWAGVGAGPADQRVVRRRWPLIVAVAMVSVLVGAASMFLATHWLTDDLAGWLVGGALLAVLAATAQHELPVARPPCQYPAPRDDDATQPARIRAADCRTPPLFPPRTKLAAELSRVGSAARWVLG
jgi:hypothetical protein